MIVYIVYDVGTNQSIAEFKTEEGAESYMYGMMSDFANGLAIRKIYKESNDGRG